MAATSVLRQIATALPKYRVTREAIGQCAGAWLCDAAEERALFARFLTSSRVEERRFILPLEEIVRLPGQSERAKIFAEAGLELGLSAVRTVLEAAAVRAEDVDVLIFSSCTAPLIPSIDASIVNILGLSRHVTRVPMYQHGCAGGAVGLALAHRFAAHGATVLVLSVELCSLGFQAADLSAGNLVGSALFADGAACALVTPSGKGLEIVDELGTLAPQSEDLMGYDIHDDGAHLRLSRELPARLLECAAEHIPPFLARHGSDPADVNWWLVHPGGVRILELLETTFGFTPEQGRWSWEVLNSFGNMSSASVFFVLQRFMAEHCYGTGDLSLLVGVGPGLTMQQVLLRAGD